MVRAESRHLVNLVPSSFSGIVPASHLSADSLDQIGRRDYQPGVALRVRIQPHQLQRYDIQAGLLLHLADKALLGRLVVLSPSAGDAPHPLERLFASTDKEYLAPFYQDAIARERSHGLGLLLRFKKVMRTG